LKRSISEIITTCIPDLSHYEAIYKDLHQYPGLSLQENRAAKVAAGHLRCLSGFKVTTGIGGHGLIGVLSNGPGRTVLLRADTDALPVKELTDLPYASKAKEVDVADGVEKPVMHACGHDMHVACMLAAATALHAAQEHWSGTLVILFQPNEERGGGARAMIDDGLYDSARHACPPPDIVLGQHVMWRAAGTLGTRRGAFASSADSFELTLHGRGGHASQPHRTIDPVVLAAYVILRIQSIVAREVDPRDSAVVTVASVQAGLAENIIADYAVLKINVRAVKPETRAKVLESLRRIVKAECDASGCEREPEWKCTSSFPFMVNDENVTAALEPYFMEYFGPARYSPSADPLGGSEDFSILATEAPRKDGGKGVPYSYWCFGGTDPEKWKDAERRGRLKEEIPINHSAYFAPVIQPTLRTGVDGLVVGAWTFLSK
jgi:amidohydrolase